MRVFFVLLWIQEVILFEKKNTNGDIKYVYFLKNIFLPPVILAYSPRKPRKKKKVQEKYSLDINTVCPNLYIISLLCMILLVVWGDGLTWACCYMKSLCLLII